MDPLETLFALYGMSRCNGYRSCFVFGR